LASYKVPQNIDMEDRIVGPLTMLQFVYLLIGGMIVYVSWMLFDLALFTIIAVPVGFFTLCMAFLKVQDQPFPKFIAATLLFLTKPKARVWQKEPTMSHLNIVAKSLSAPHEQSDDHTPLDRSQLQNLASVLDSGGQVAAEAPSNAAAPKPAAAPTVPSQAEPTDAQPTTPATPTGSVTNLASVLDGDAVVPSSATEAVASEPAAPDPATERLQAIASIVGRSSGSATAAAPQAPTANTVEPPTPPATGQA
jgi:hypothetical protein